MTIQFAVKFDIMFEIVKAKFFQNKDLSERLIATGDAYLEETNTWHDTVWGVCNGIGTNWLGQILSLVRLDLIHKKFIEETIDG